MKVHKCFICGKEFTGRKKKYCSPECAKEGRRRLDNINWHKRNPGRPKGIVTKVCECCGKKYKVNAQSYTQAMYCSKRCYEEKRARRMGVRSREEYLEKLQGQKEETKKRKELERKKKIKQVVCTVCGKIFRTTGKARITCSKECSEKRKKRKNDKRINEANNIDKDITLEKLFKRDKGICYICGGICSWEDVTIEEGNYTVKDKYPSIDHLIPLSRGGLHSWDNVKLAHFYCNCLKSDSLPSELGLETEIEEAYALASKAKPKSKKVKQINKNGEVVEIYESTAEAERATGIKRKGIQKCARKECKTYRGYIWEYD